MPICLVLVNTHDTFPFDAYLTLFGVVKRASSELLPRQPCVHTAAHCSFRGFSVFFRVQGFVPIVSSYTPCCSLFHRSAAPNRIICLCLAALFLPRHIVPLFVFVFRHVTHVTLSAGHILSVLGVTMAALISCHVLTAQNPIVSSLQKCICCCSTFDNCSKCQRPLLMFCKDLGTNVSCQTLRDKQFRQNTSEPATSVLVMIFSMH